MEFTITFFCWEVIVKAESVTKEGDTTTIKGLVRQYPWIFMETGPRVKVQKRCTFISPGRENVGFEMVNSEPFPFLLAIAVDHSDCKFCCEGTDESGHKEVIVFE